MSSENTSERESSKDDENITAIASEVVGYPILEDELTPWTNKVTDREQRQRNRPSTPLPSKTSSLNLPDSSQEANNESIEGEAHELVHVIGPPDTSGSSFGSPSALIRAEEPRKSSSVSEKKDGD